MNKLVSDKANFYIYRNLHKDCFSIKYKNKVIKYSNIILIKNAIFDVKEKGRLKVLEEKRKNVHAYIKSKNLFLFDNLEQLKFFLIDENIENFSFNSNNEIYYNPYITKSFIFNNKEIKNCSLSVALNNKIYLIPINNTPNYKII